MVSSEDAIAIYGLLALAGIPAWLSGGWGIDALLSVAVRCLAPDAQVRLHTGYSPPPQQVADLERLRARFGL